MTLLHLAAFLTALMPALVTIVGLHVATRREGPRPLTLTEIAYREGRQCMTAIYSWGGGPPDRCAYPEDHYGECEP